MFVIISSHRKWKTGPTSVKKGCQPMKNSTIFN